MADAALIRCSLLKLQWMGISASFMQYLTQQQ